MIVRCVSKLRRNCLELGSSKILIWMEGCLDEWWRDEYGREEGRTRN